MLGVLWLDHDWLKERGCNPDLKCSNIEEREKLIELADEIMSCELPEESEKDPEQTMLRDFVLESQIHRHTNACERIVKKKDGDKDLYSASKVQPNLKTRHFCIQVCILDG